MVAAAAAASDRRASTRRVGSWLILLLSLAITGHAFAPHPLDAARSRSTSLFMGRKSLNKQSDLRRKMELAKQQKEQGQAAASSTGSNDPQNLPLTDQQQKERNDRLRFEELLKKESANVLNDFSSDGYLTKQQEEAEITAAERGIDRIFEGDPAPVECFEELLAVQTGEPIGVAGRKALVPWNNHNNNDFLVVLTDPRPQSDEFQETVQLLQETLPTDVRQRLVYINADTAAQNRRWLKKVSLPSNLRLYADPPHKPWMRAYTALGETRWSMTMFIVGNERVQKLAREVNQYGAAKTIINAVKSLNERRV